MVPLFFHWESKVSTVQWTQWWLCILLPHATRKRKASLFESSKVTSAVCVRMQIICWPSITAILKWHFNYHFQHLSSNDIMKNNANYWTKISHSIVHWFCHELSFIFFMKKRNSVSAAALSLQSSADHQSWSYSTRISKQVIGNPCEQWTCMETSLLPGWGEHERA